MSVLSRLFKVGQAKAEKLVDKLENPEEMLEMAIKDKDKQLRDAKKSLMSVIATERSTKAELERENSAKKEWEKKAEQAILLGKDDLAAKALVRSQEHADRADSIKTSWEMQKSEVDKLKIAIKSMDDQIAELKRNKDFIIAQSKSAQIKKEIYEAKAKITNSSSTDDLIERMKKKAERTNFEAEAALELSETQADSLEKEFEALEGVNVDTSIQDKLAEMKRNLGK